MKTRTSYFLIVVLAALLACTGVFAGTGTSKGAIRAKASSSAALKQTSFGDDVFLTTSANGLRVTDSHGQTHLFAGATAACFQVIYNYYGFGTGVSTQTTANLEIRGPGNTLYAVFAAGQWSSVTYPPGEKIGG